MCVPRFRSCVPGRFDSGGFHAACKPSVGGKAAAWASVCRARHGVCYHLVWRVWVSALSMSSFFWIWGLDQVPGSNLLSSKRSGEHSRRSDLRSVETVCASRGFCPLGHVRIVAELLPPSPLSVGPTAQFSLSVTWVLLYLPVLLPSFRCVEYLISWVFRACVRWFDFVCLMLSSGGASGLW